jgi:hypothetical protein
VISSGRNDFERISRHGGMYTTFWGWGLVTLLDSLQFPWTVTEV